MATRWEEVGHAAGQVQLLGAGQLPGQGELVDGLVPLKEGHGGVEAELVPLPVEVAALQQGSQAGDALAVDEQGASTASSASTSWGSSFSA